ncbi:MULTISPECIES: hypothetical protein [unclassified Duganella]|nr:MULTISPECIES: hypothetical protein [unclassified Duganella]
MTLSAAATPERMVFAWAEPYMWLKNMIILRGCRRQRAFHGGLHC